MIDAKTRVAFPVVAEVVPEREDLLVRVNRADRVDPSLREQALIGIARLGLQQGILAPMLRVVDVEVSRHDVVVACEDHRLAAVVKRLRMLDEPLEPRELVDELLARLRIAVR